MQPMLPHTHSGLPAVGMPSVSISQSAISARAVLYFAPVHSQDTGEQLAHKSFVTMSAAKLHANTDIGKTCTEQLLTSLLPKCLLYDGFSIYQQLDWNLL